jgi:hypothetical protein
MQSLFSATILIFDIDFAIDFRWISFPLSQRDKGLVLLHLIKSYAPLKIANTTSDSQRYRYSDNQNYLRKRTPQIPREN